MTLFLLPSTFSVTDSDRAMHFGRSASAVYGRENRYMPHVGYVASFDIIVLHARL